MTSIEAALPDLEAIKGRQQRTWASGDYAAVAARITLIAERLVEAADLRAGSTVLDVATGSGNAALAAARADCDVTGLDYVPELLERGRLRAAAEGLDVTFVDGDAERLPFADASFDAVLSCLGVMFTADQERAAGELLRVARPGATIALANWTPTGFIGDLLRTVGRHVPPPAGLRPPVAWGTEERLVELLGDGVADLALNTQSFVFRFASADGFVDFFRANYGPVHKAFEALGEDDRHQLHRELASLAAASSHAAGPAVAIASEYVEAVATRR